MNAVALLFSWSGRLAPRSFAIAVVLVYLASFFSQALLSVPVTSRMDLWPFALLQVALVWAWVVLHVKRLRDAGRSLGLVAGIACLYVLALLLLLLVLLMITASETTASNFLLTGQGLIHIFIVLYAIGAVLGSSEFGVLAYWLMGFLALLLLPVIVGVGFSIWAGTRPRAP
jgi:uncharacterized membrane protein YhaH (DUF805 family)